MVLEVIAQHLGGERVDGSACGRDRPDDLLAPSLVGERARSTASICPFTLRIRATSFFLCRIVCMPGRYPQGYPMSSIAT